MAEAAAPPTYQCLLNESFYQQGQGGQVKPYCSLFLPGDSGNGVEYPGQQTNFMQFWVLLDQNPLNPPQQFASPDSSTVPAGLSQLMDSNHLLVAGFAGAGTQAPSGDLFNFMMANGSGPMLTALDQLNSNLACGVFAMAFYGMASIPGQGPASGIEFLDYPAYVTYADGTQTSWQGALPFTLMPDGTGGYVPIASL